MPTVGGHGRHPRSRDRTRGLSGRAPSEGARYLLPPEAYTSEAWFAREQRDLFGRTWNLVAYEADLPEPGDHLPVQVGLDPVLVVRGRMVSCGPS